MIADAILRQIEALRPAGLALSRCQVTDEGDNTVLIRLGWRDTTRRGLETAQRGDSPAGPHHAVRVDLDNLPAGVSALEWTAPEDTDIRLHLGAPIEPAVIDAARAVGAEYVDRLDGDNLRIWIMRL